MSNELAQHGGSELVLSDDQTFWTPNQKAALAQMGVDRATDADLAVFFHQCTRTGLDPFARQIYMIQREGKQTIQTGIDGFRLIGRRAVDRTRETLEVSEAEWCGQDGVWRDVWLAQEPPAAARVTVYRNGGKFPAIALYSEYVGLKRDGNVTKMWATRPAGQLAKCAEALAWRKAFPQDLSGLYTNDEMAQADNPGASMPRRQQPQPQQARQSRDWLAELDRCDTAVKARTLYEECAAAGELTRDIEDQIVTAGKILAANESRPDDGEVVDGQLIDEETGEIHAA